MIHQPFFDAEYRICHPAVIVLCLKMKLCHPEGRIEIKELLKWCNSYIVDYNVCKAVLSFIAIAAMENERGTDYSPPPYVKVSTIKVIPSKSLTNCKHRSVSLLVTAVGTFHLIGALFSMSFMFLHCRALQFCS